MSNCRIDIKDGQIDSVRDENGQESKLYNQILQFIPDRGEALIEYDRIGNSTIDYEKYRNDEVNQLFDLATASDGSTTGYFKHVSANLKKALAHFGYEIKRAISGDFYVTKNGVFTNLFRPITPAVSRVQNEELDSKLKKILGDFGISVEQLETSRYKNYSSKGIADIVQKAIYVAHNRFIDTLPEEVAHFYVESLQYSGSPLFDSMMNEIEKFQIFKDVVREYSDDFKGNIAGLKKEAIGKAIAQYVVSNYEGTTATLKEAERTRRWFNKVLNWFQAKMSDLGFTQPVKLENYFDLAAKNILNGSFGEIGGEGVYQQISNRPTNKFDAKLKANDKLIRTNGPVKEIFRNDSWQKIKRVSDVVKEKGFGFFGTRTKEQQRLDNIKADFGTKVHADISELVKEETGDAPIADTLGESGFKQQLRKLVQELVEQHKGGSFYTEINVFKTKDTRGKASDLAGTIDLLVIDKNGVAHIYDWKTVTELTSKNSLDTKQFKLKWHEQLSQYRGILSAEYGISKFGESRIIPMDVRYEDEIPTVLTLGDRDDKTNTMQLGADALLSPVPLLEENTDDRVLNHYLNTLRDKIKNVRSSKVFNKVELIGEYERAIAKILITKDINEAEEVVQREWKFYDNVLGRIDAGEPLTVNDIARIFEIQDFYQNAFQNKFVRGDSLIADMARRVDETSEFVDNAIEKTLDAFGVSQFDIVKHTSKLDYANQLSDYDIPIFQAFHELMVKTWSSIEVKLRKKKEDLLSLKQQIEKETGKSGIDMFDSIIEFDDKGNRTRNLIKKRNSKWAGFYKDNAKELFKVHDRENPLALDTYFKHIKKTKLGALITDFAGFEFELRKRVKDFEDSRDDYDNEYAIKYRNRQISSLLSVYSTRFETPVEYLTGKYKETIHDKPDSALAKLYNLFLETNRLAASECDSNIRGTTLPFVKKGVISAMVDAPLDLRTASGTLSKFRVDEWTTQETDSSGERVYKIPLKYDNKNGSAFEQSFDLVEVLALWQETVESNIALQKIENTTKVFRHALRKNKQYVVENGRVVKSQSGEFDTKKIENSTIENFDDYVHKYVYGEGMKDDNETVFGYSRNKLVKTALSYFSAKSLFGSIFSGVANITGGVANIFGVAIRTGHFNMGDITKAINDFANPAMENHSKLHVFRHLFGIDVNTYENPKNKDLSVDWFNRNMTFDKVFFLQKAGDTFVQNITLGAYLKNVKLVKNEDGSIRFEKADTTNIYDQLVEKDGVMQVDGLDLHNEQHNLEFFKLREKIRGDIAQILGTASEYDQFLAGNELKGAMFMQFRRWILPMFNSRFGRLKYNGIQEEYRQGKYRSVAQTVFTNRFGSMIAELVGLKDGATFDELITKKWEQEQELNPDLTYEDFRAMTVRNLHSTMTDLVILGLIGALKYSLGGFDDDKKKKTAAQKILLRGLTRSSSELSFWFSPTSFTDILNAPVPIIGLATSVAKIISNSGWGFWDMMTGNDDDSEKELKKAKDEMIKMTIGFNTWYSFQKELDKK